MNPLEKNRGNGVTKFLTMSWTITTSMGFTGVGGPGSM